MMSFTRNSLPFGLILLIFGCAVSQTACTKGTATASKTYRSLYEIPRSATALLPDGKKLRVQLALSEEEQIQGLSGVKAADFADDQGMLFVYLQAGPRQFWMPDTYFDLDIFFLTEDLKVIDVDRDVKHHPGRTEPPPIVRTRSIVSFHILEIKASSPWAKALKPGDKLRWESKPSFDEILKNLNKFSGI